MATENFTTKPSTLMINSCGVVD
ncbi:hypothetical protein CLIM01_09356 [Colletotrichum limetticola]|uniref:Uncharacterized protein n=1 Tax=Colletotrichum limetticola TaxID=1209924 RepID=A0ABQ9PP30_9PEZI|nr:hypothetical protein CLIM01_09356 [Colletotrichum limetticola]